MNILFLSNWSIYNGITRATIFPIIENLDKDPQIGKIIFCTVENECDPLITGFNKTLHIPLSGRSPRGFGKQLNFLRLAFDVRKILKNHDIDFVWCRGATAGGLGVIVNLITGAPFIVDSFEPHAHYMLDSGTWKKKSYKFIIQRWLEGLMKKRARFLLPVSYKFYQYLLAEGLHSSKLFTFPCVVNLEAFKFSKEDRSRIRTALKILPQTIVGVYTGKFGGLYYEEEAFELYKYAFDFWKNNFFLIILTEMDRHAISDQLKQRGIPGDRIFIHKASHHEIPQYLSAADFAFCSIKSVPSMQYCSPIKNGEYWASDLPVLTTLGFGDDADILNKEGGGIIINVFQDDMASKFMALKNLIGRGRTGFNASLASKYRNPSTMDTAIQFVIKGLVTKNQAGD